MELSDRKKGNGNDHRGQSHNGQHGGEALGRYQIGGSFCDEQCGQGSQDDNRLLIELHDVQFGGAGRAHKQNGQGPPAQQHHDQQRQIRRKHAGEQHGGKSITPQGVIDTFEDAQTDVRQKGF